MVRKDGSTRGFETNRDWRVGDQQSAQNQHAVETGSNGSAPWGYLPQQLGKPVNLSDFDAVAKPFAVILLTIVGTIALWLLASRFVAAARNEPLRYALARDALFHAPITVGLLFLLLPKYDVRFPIDWPFQPKFVALAVVALLAVRLLHFVPRRRTTGDLSARIRQIKNTVSADALPYLLLATIIGLGFAFRYNDYGAMSFDHDEYGLVQKSKGIWELGFPFNRVAGEIRPATTYELVPYPVGAEFLSPAAVPIHGDAYLLVFLRRDQSSSIPTQISDRSDRDFLRCLSVMGGKRIYPARSVPCLTRCALGRMVVAKRIPSLPLRLLYGCASDRAVLLAHARFITLSADRLRAFQPRQPFPVFSKVWLATDVLRGPFVIVGEPYFFHPHDSSRNPILLAPTRLPLRCYGAWRPGFLPHELDCGSIYALLHLLSTASYSLRSSCDCRPLRSAVIACPARRQLHGCSQLCAYRRSGHALSAIY